MATMRIPKQKVILCGDYGVGKSSLFRRFATNTFVTDTDRKSTLGLDHIDREYSVNEKQIKLQLWDTGGMERVASVTSSYYKFAEGAILVFALDNAASFHSLSQHLLDIVTYAENAKIFICGNKSDLEGREPEVSDEEVEAFCEQCHSLISATYKTSCRSGAGVEEMFRDISRQLVHANRSKMELQALEHKSFQVDTASSGAATNEEDASSCGC
ncbi:ras-related protein Rab-14 [Drosophila erecta]|nr:ras-related protein Rab-14 [Drosophila erecta]XP_002093033.3 ras-related protein Rab-14 [Drosophila yakuba]XP_039488402.1 ras-related protein Rab-14 [Drosophila santomea]XP_043648003.1 ras-related protein Rab-14 [Drosophila teissieri]